MAAEAGMIQRYRVPFGLSLSTAERERVHRRSRFDWLSTNGDCASRSYAGLGDVSRGRTFAASSAAPVFHFAMNSELGNTFIRP